MDRTGANFEEDLKSIREKLTVNAQPINIPIGAEDKFEGVIDLIQFKAVYFEGHSGQDLFFKEVPENLKESALNGEIF